MNLPPRLRTTATRAALAAAGLAAALAVLVAGSRVELRLLDLRFAAARLAEPAEPRRDVALLLVDTRSEARVGRTYDSSWRVYYPELIDRLASGGTRAVVFDSVFAASEPALDPLLADRLRSAPPVASGESTDNHPSAGLRDAFRVIGWLEVLEYGGIPRFVPTGTPTPPLSLVAAELARSGGASMEPEGPGYWIDFSFDFSRVPTFSIADVILADQHRLADERRTPLSYFAERTVFVGTALPATDLYVFPGTHGRRLPGVYGQIAATLTLLDGRSIRRPTRPIELALLLAVSAAAGAAAMMSRRRARWWSTAGIVAVTVLAPLIAFVVSRLWLPYGPLLAASGVPAAAAFGVRRARALRGYRTSLGFDPELLERYRSAVEGEASGLTRSAAILVADIREYTQFVTDNDPAVVHQVVSEYMHEMEAIIHDNGGYVNKYVGDEIVAVFGFPRAEETAVERAVRAGLGMISRLKELRDAWRSAGLPPLTAVGVGIDHGEVRFSSVGGARRSQFDIIGNPVNGASRLQTLTKELELPLLVPAEVAGAQRSLPVAEAEPVRPAQEAHLAFVGEVLIRGQGRRQLYGLRGDPANREPAYEDGSDG